MIAIADSGSTKTDWLLIQDGHLFSEVSTIGLNPVFHTPSSIADAIQQPLQQASGHTPIEQIFFYGSGCWDQKRKAVVAEGLTKVFPGAKLDIHHDLLGAARAACGHQPGIACILGTGSNSCLYDGNDVIDNVTNLGYLLGDEGSGTHLGKKLIRAYFYRELPEDLITAFEVFYPDGKTGILDHLYEGPSPNTFLAKFSPFLSKHYKHPFVEELVGRSFEEFLRRHVFKYEGYQELPTSFVGSIAYHFRHILFQKMDELGLQAGIIVQKPIKKLLEFHQSDFLQHQ
jgi:glucosamine kinase